MEKLYLMSIEESRSISEAFCLCHFPKRFERSKKFYHEEDRLRSIGAGTMLYRFCGIDEEKIQTEEYGKPFSPDFDGKYNISHSGMYACLAVDDEEIGVDIEKISSRHISIAKRVFQEEEQLWMQKDSVNRFFILWTLKESVMKYFGEGLKMTPSSFSVLSAAEGNVLKLKGRILYCKTFEINDHMLSLCCGHPIIISGPEMVVSNR